MKMRQTYLDGTKQVLVDPNDFRNTLTVTNTRSPKKAGGVTAYNVRSELKFVTVSELPVKEGCDTCSVPTETISTTVTMSGSVENKSAVIAQIDQLVLWLNLAKLDLTSGFLPEIDYNITE